MNKEMNQEEKVHRSRKKTVYRLSGEIRQYKKDALLSPLFTIFCVILEILIPYLTASIIDQGISVGDMGHVARVGLLMAVMAALAMVCGVQAGVHSSRASTGFASNLRMAMFEQIQAYSFANIDKFSTAGLVTRLTTDVTNIQMAFQMILMMCTRAPVTLIVALIMAFSINAKLSLVFLAVMIVLLIMLVILVPMAMRYFRQMFKKYDAVNGVVKENVGAIRVVKAFVREKYENSKFVHAVTDLYNNSVSAERIISLNMPVMMLCVYSCILLISWFGANMIVSHTGLTTGELTSLLSYVMNILMSLMMLSMVFVMITQSMAAAQRIEEVLEEQPEIVSPEQAVTEVKDGSIDFNHVSFSYKKRSGKPVLSDIDLHIHSGETIGILGGTGSSKSSLVSLISRLYDVSEGDVRVGGVDVRRYDVEVLRNAVAVVLQNNVLFSGTIYDNLRWGDENATDEQCREACRLACADEFIERFPQGYNTYIERGGTNVSGGQKQRLCIARALLKNAPIVLLDEATASMDAESETLVQDALSVLLKDKTVMVIAHRMRTVANADKIVVLDDGKVSEMGTPAELMKKGGLYAHLVELQQGK